MAELAKIFNTELHEVFIKETNAFVPRKAAEVIQQVIPSHDAEALMLSRGLVMDVVGNPLVAGGIRGDFDHNRFIKGYRTYVADAVRKERGVVVGGVGFTMVGFGNYKQLNQATKIYWRTSAGRGNQLLSSMPFDGNLWGEGYIGALEHGGTWEVVPRPDNTGRALKVEVIGSSNGKNVYLLARRVLKEMKPIHMYEQTSMARGELIGKLKTWLKARLAQIM